MSELTERQLEVLHLLAEGRTNRDIARALGISEHTARTHVERIRRAFGARTRGEAVATAYAQGLLEPVRRSTQR